MAVNASDIRTIDVLEAPDFPGLSFRGFRGEEDYPLMHAAIMGSKEADGDERSDTVEDIARTYSHLHNCDPETDMLFVEVDGEVVGYQRVTWWKEEETGYYLYTVITFLLPEWRGMGLWQAMLAWGEDRLREIAAGHPAEAEKFFDAWSPDDTADRTALYTGTGYEPVAYHADMVRPTLENILDLPVPDGLEIRPVKPEHYRLIWEADKEAFQDHWGYTEDEYNEEAYKNWQEDKTIFMPELWKIAWDIEKNEVAGQVRSFIAHRENEEYNRKRGYTEFISVRRPYRRRGLAKKLIAESLHELKRRGMEEAALGVHTDNPNGAFQLYEFMGYQMVRRFTSYRKPMIPWFDDDWRGFI